MGGFSILCRQPDPGCDNPYAKKPESYEAAMLRSGFHKFGLGLSTILKQHSDHKAVSGIISQLATDLRGKFRIIADIMKNAADQAQWEEILYLVGEQFGSIGRKLGPNEINYVGLDKDFEIAGDLFAQFVDEHKVEFHYPSVQEKFEVWRADIAATFGSVSAVLTTIQPKLANGNIGHLAATHDAMVRSMILALSVPPPKLMNLNNVQIMNLNSMNKPHKKSASKKQ